MADFLGSRIIDVTIDQVTNQVPQTSLSLKQVVSKTFTQYWTLTATLEPYTIFTLEDGLELSARFRAYELNPFDFPFPQPKLNGRIIGSASSTNAGQKQVTVSAITLPVGRFISFSSHRKVYQITNISGNQMTIYPELRENISGTVNTSPTMKVGFLSIPSFQFRDSLGTFTLRMRELL